MKTIGVVLLLLSIGLPSVLSIKCYTCHAHNSENCQGEETQCPEGSSCMTVSETYECNHTYHSIQKRCSNNLHCDTFMYAFVADSLYYELSRACCEGDLCNNGTFEMPNKTYDNNGPECPVCASFDTLERCKPTGRTVCRSSTDQCGLLVGWLKKPDGVSTKYSVQGCVSGNSCQYDCSQSVGYFMEKIIEFKCWLPKPDISKV